MKHHRFAQQMRVRREEKRKIYLDVPAVLVQRLQETRAQGRWHLSARQMVDPDPGECAKSDLQRTDPIDAALARVRLDPAFQLQPDLGEQLRIGIEQVELREQNQ